MAAGSYRFSVDQQPDHVEIGFAGLLTADTIVAILDEIRWSEVRRSRLGLLWDLRGADLSAYRIEDMSTVRSYDDAARRAAVPAAGQRRRFRIAAVFQGDANQLILRLWETAADVPDDLERRSFDDIEAARRWVAGP